MLSENCKEILAEIGWNYHRYYWYIEFSWESPQGDMFRVVDIDIDNMVKEVAKCARDFNPERYAKSWGIDYESDLADAKDIQVALYELADTLKESEIRIC